MTIKFLNQTIEIRKSDRLLSYPFYDVNYSYKIIYISSHIDLAGDVDREQLNNIILKGCIDIAKNTYCGLGANENPVYDYLLSKVNILEDVYTIENGKQTKLFKGGNK